MPGKVPAIADPCGLCLIRASKAAGLAASLPFDALVATIVIAAAPAIIDAALSVMSVTTTVPALAVSVAIAAIIQARPVPAVDVETNRDILDRVHGVDHEARARRSTQRRRRSAARHQHACRENGSRRAERQKKTMHVQNSLNENSAWIAPYHYNS